MLLIVWFTSRRQSCQRTSVSLLKVTKVTPILCVNTLSSVFLSNAETCYPGVLFFFKISYAAIWVALHLKRIPSVTRFNKSSPTLHGSQSSSLNWTSTLALDELFFSWYLTSSFFPLNTFYSPHAATIHVYCLLLYAGWGTPSCGPDCNREWFRQRGGLTSRGDGYRHL